MREGRERRGSGGGEGLRLGKRGQSHGAAKMEEEEEERRSCKVKHILVG